MFSDFLECETTFPTELRDFTEWHKGVKYFGFWAIEVSSPGCLEKISEHQSYLADKLHSNYCRQPHITLVPSGLLSENNVNQGLITKQIDQIMKRKIKPFKLRLSACNSFSTCPYLSIYDPLNTLNGIRESLRFDCEDNKLEQYIPHVTLGFYDAAYNASDVVNNISMIKSADVEFTVNEIVFACYETKDVQGPYQVLHRVKLDSFDNELR